MALTLAWMSACGIDGVKITTFGPKSGLVALAPSFASAEAWAPPGSTATPAMINPAMPTTLITGLTIRRMTAPHCAESVLHGVGSKANVSVHCRMQPACGSDVSRLLTVVPTRWRARPAREFGLGLDVVVVDPRTKLPGVYELPVPAVRRAVDLVVSFAVAPRIGLHDIGPAPSHPRVVAQRRGHLRRGSVLEHGRQREGVLDALVSALAEVGEHRVGRVAEQRQAAAGPFGQRLTIVKPPPERRVDP